ncbi:MAG: hypothetical protein R3B05_11355 [Nitrospira sp.]
MAWFKKDKSRESGPPPRSKSSEGMWLKCNHCREIVYRKEVDRNNKGLSKERLSLPDLGDRADWITHRSWHIQRMGC